MSSFETLDDEAKLHYHSQLMQAVVAFGGVNFFLQLLEAIRKIKPNALSLKSKEFAFELGYIRWSKVIFLDKVNLLAKTRYYYYKNSNLLPNLEDKNYKNAYNLVCALKPIEFSVKRKNLKDGVGFDFYPIEIIDEQTSRLNPIFDAIFFCPIDMVKEAINYKVSKI